MLSNIQSILYFILLFLSIDSIEQDLLSTNDIKPCLSESMERIFFDRSYQNKFDCSSLPSYVQTELALHLTFCHLNSTGIQPDTICSKLTIDTNINECLKNISHNPFAYLTYTNFIPHIQSICYAIETQRWHNQAKNTVFKLNLHSKQIETQAKDLLIEQETIQTNLEQALTVNQDSVDDALNADRFLQTAQSDVEELRGHLFVKDRAQIELIQEILETLFNIQSSLFTDAFGLSSYLFYGALLIAIHLLTIPERTNDSKFWLIILWISLICVERYILLFSSYSQILLYNILWRLRQLWFFVTCLILTYHGLRYRNYVKENQKLIDEINRKHRQLEVTARKCLNVINQFDSLNDSTSDVSLNSSFEYTNLSTSSTYSIDANE